MDCGDGLGMIGVYLVQTVVMVKKLYKVFPLLPNCMCRCVSDASFGGFMQKNPQTGTHVSTGLLLYFGCCPSLNYRFKNPTQKF